MAATDRGDRARDYVMARTGAAIASLDAAKAALIESLQLYISPEDDKKGAERKELLDGALEAASCACRAMEDIETKIEDVDMALCEPWEDDEEEEEEDDPEDEDDKAERKKRKKR